MTATGKILTGESNEDYHASEAISHSKLEVFAERPALFKRKYLDKAIAETSKDHFTFGTAFHEAVLEPELFARKYAEQPADIKVRRGKAWDAFKAEQVAAGLEILRADEIATLDAMQAAVCGNPYAVDLIEAAGNVREATFRTEGSEWGCSLQCRPDVTNPSGCEFSAGVPYNADVKTVASMADFERHFFNFGYYRQQPFYQIVQGICGSFPQRFFYIVVEKQEPFGCSVLEVDSLSFQEGEKEVRESLEKLRQCRESNEWPNAPMTGHIGLPEWRVNQILAVEATK